MNKLITTAQVFVILVVLSAIAIGADQVIQYTEKMVGAGHPTLADTLNRALLVDHETDGTHSASTIGSSQITDGAIVNADINASAAIDATKIGGGLVTNTELSYLDNVTSAIQTQLGLKAPIASPTFTGTVTIPTADITSATIGSVTNTEISYLSGVTSAIQTQMGLKAPILNPTFTNNVTIDNEATALQYNSSGADNTHYFNVANSGPPNSGTESIGDCYYDNVLLIMKCWGGSSWDNVGSTSVSLVDNSIAPVKLQTSAGTRNSSSYYRGDGAWGVPAGISSISMVSARPGSPSAGDIWFLTTDNTLYIRGTGGTFNTAALTWVVDGGSPPDDFTDDFNRASLGGNYTTVTALVTLAISSNQLAGTDAATVSMSRRNDFTGGEDQYAFATVIDNTDPCGVNARTSTSAKTYYRYSSYAGASSLERIVAGSATELVGSGSNFAVNDVIKITTTGSNPVVVKGYINDVEDLTYDDSAAGRLSGGYPAWHILGLTGRLDNAGWGVQP